MNLDFLKTIFTMKEVLTSLTFMAILLIMSPSASFLFWGWKQRQREILSGINSKDDVAIKTFFIQFHPKFEAGISNPQKRFQKYYNSEFGRFHFLIPIIVFFLICIILLNICTGWMYASTNYIIIDKMKAIGLFSILGAYLWVLSDQITRWWNSNLSPSDLYWASFRFIVSVPLGFAVSQLVADNIAPAIAFFLGTFPTDTLFSFFRKFSREKLGMGDAPEGKESELQLLHGIDARNAERFTNEGITTISQLAYCDPIKITIRTNLGYSYIVDCVSQALLWIYTENDISIWRKAGIRSAFEIKNLMDDLEDGDRQEKKEAEDLVALLADQLKTKEIAILKTIEEVALDPYTKFIYNTWVTDDENED